MKRTVLLKTLALGLLAFQTGCLEITYSNGPVEEQPVQTGTYEDVALNPETSPYYTEPVLPEPTMTLASAEIASIAPAQADAQRSMPDIDMTGEERRSVTAVMKYGSVVGAGVTIAGDGKEKLLVLAKDASAFADVPKEIDGMQTQVEVVGAIKAAAYNTRAKFRPVIPAGVSVGNGRENSAGTIGAVVMKNGIRYMLSNNHVLARQNNAQIGEQIVQPGRADTRGVPSETIAILSAYKPVSFTQNNQIDAAIARYTGYHSYSVIDQAFKPSQIIASARAGQAVMKMGRTTGLTKGIVQSTNVTIKVDFDGRTAVFQNQIYVKGDLGDFLKAGDSGSLLVTQQGAHPIGLLFAGGDGSAFANPIKPVLDYFGVTMVGQ
ncbi:MAG TPA: hypothetical protein VFH43_11530 [Candidatus Kapabacteria bacterium]|nr:hypothetical protein [Candidatus Kapabacteria bacterium]